MRCVLRQCLECRADPRADRKPLGISNCGNSCFAGTALQCLLSTPALWSYFQDGSHGKTCKRPQPNDWCLLCDLEALFKKSRESSRVPISVVV